MSVAKRLYRQTARAAAAESLRRGVVTAFNDLLLNRWIDEITLDEVAASAGTTRQTVIRLFGGKDGLLEAVMDLVRAEAVPRTSMAADVSARAALEALVAHYEAVGDMVVRFLAQEERHSALRPLLAQGRHEHRAWVAERFGSTQSGLSELERERQITRLIVATDIYTWKLLRRDFGKSQDEVLHLMVGIINKERGDSHMTHAVAAAVGELDPIVRSSRKLRVLMAHWDGSGNTPPQRALARELNRRGHDVHVLSHDTLAKAVIADGGRFHALPSAPQWDPAQPRTNEEEGAFVVQNVVGSSAFAADFLAVRDAVRPDICLIDAMLISTLNVAIERRLPFAAINHIAWIREGACAGFLNSIIATLPGAAAGSTFFDLLERAPLVLATSYPAFGTQRKTASHVHFVGPIREPVALDPWPRRSPDRPFVLVSLSSMFQGQESTLRNICEAVSVLPIEVLVTTGRGIAPNALSVSGGVEARSFVPHDAVLPSVDLVVTHAGFGTLMYSAGAGKPTLCLPNGRDQNDNAARVEAMGLGRTLSPDAPPAAISSAVMDMLGDEALRAASRSFASGVSRFGELTHAADLIERAVDHVLGSTQGIGDNAACVTTASASQCLPMSF